MTDEQIEVNEELETEELEAPEAEAQEEGEGEEEETEFAEGKKKMSKQGEEDMEDEDEEGEDEDMEMSAPAPKKKGKKAAEMSEDHEEISHDSECSSKKKKKGMEEYGDCDCQHEESEDEIAAAHGEETGKAKDGVGEDRMKKAKSKDVQGEGGLHAPKKGKAKEADGYGKSATHSYAKVPSTKHAYPKGVEVDYEEGDEVSADHYESPMEMTGDTRMANVVEQITKENQLEAMMKQIEHLSSQVKLVEEENERLRVAAEKAMKDKRRQELQAFVSSLYESGKLTDAVMTQEKLVGFCEGLDDGTLEFSEEGETPSGVLLNLLANLPAQVEFGEFSMGMMDFEEEEELTPHEMATRISQEESISYVDALKRVLY
jgi:hypothetical protein